LVLETAIAKAEQVNPAINAIVHKQYEQARKAVAAGLPDGPLKGVPYLIKDLGCFETDEPATFGSSLFKDFVADHDTAYVTRCKKAGLVFIGRSSSPEFGLNPNTEPRLYGSCHNPWNLEYSPGGAAPLARSPADAARPSPHIRSEGIEAVPGRTPSYDWANTRHARGGRPDCAAPNRLP
jgi:amidase